MLGRECAALALASGLVVGCGTLTVQEENAKHREADIARSREQEKPCLEGARDGKALSPAEQFDACHDAGLSPYMPYWSSGPHGPEIAWGEGKTPAEQEADKKRREPFLAKACAIELEHFTKEPRRSIDPCVFWGERYKLPEEKVVPMYGKICEGALSRPPLPLADFLNPKKMARSFMKPTAYGKNAGIGWGGYTVFTLDVASFRPESACLFDKMIASKLIPPVEQEKRMLLACARGSRIACSNVANGAFDKRPELRELGRKQGFETAASRCEAFAEPADCDALGKFLPNDPRIPGIRQRGEAAVREREATSAYYANLEASQSAELARQERERRARNAAALEETIQANLLLLQAQQSRVNVAPSQPSPPSPPPPGPALKTPAAPPPSIAVGRASAPPPPPAAPPPAPPKETCDWGVHSQCLGRCESAWGPCRGPCGHIKDALQSASCINACDRTYASCKAACPCSPHTPATGRGVR